MPEWLIEESDVGTRVDQLLAAKWEITRGEAQRLIESGDALLNGAQVRCNVKVRINDHLTADRPDPVSSELIPENIPIDVVYSDEHLMVINKARGMVVHPAPGSETGTLVHAMLGRMQDDDEEYSSVGGVLRPGIVHRLDRDTSGLMVVARTDAAHHSLQAQIAEKSAQRRYLAIVWGRPTAHHVIVEAPIGRHPVDRKKMAVVTDRNKKTRDAITELLLQESIGPFSILEARLQTGRTHQIRVHCQYIKLPVVGDSAYGGLRKLPSDSLGPKARIQLDAAIAGLGGQALHAASLSFDHPATGERMEFKVDPPPIFQNLLELMRESFSGRRGES
ncbi:MAG: RluA family pseudouridine synthase [Chthonomonadales bacterium]